MDAFLHKHSEKINSVLSCFDRIIFKGYLPISGASSMESFLYSNGLLLKDFKKFVPLQAQKLKDHAHGLAEKYDRPIEYLNHHVRKEDKAREIAKKDNIKDGLVCIFTCLETCGSFKLKYGKGKPILINAPRKCQCIYFYFNDREFGIMHVRIQTWFPFSIQVYINGHEWLAKKMDRHGLKYDCVDNAFCWLENPKRAQMFADRMVNKNWVSVLDGMAKRVNPLLKNLLKDFSYYWVVSQSEYATDIIFKDRSSLSHLYKKLLQHGTTTFGADDIFTFLGRKMNGNFKGEFFTDYKNKRYPGARIKHCMKSNWIKMYDKHGLVLRIETVINNPREFKMRKRCKRNGEWVMAWVPMKKSVEVFDRHKKVALRANMNYIRALTHVNDPGNVLKKLDKIGNKRTYKGRTVRGFNPLNKDDQKLFKSVMRGEHCINGFRNKDIRNQLFSHQQKKGTFEYNDSAKVSRLLKRLHVHGLIAKIPRSRKWKVTFDGYKFMDTAVKLKEEIFLSALDAA